MARLSRVTGLADARKVLKQLPERVQKRVMGAATRAGATLLRQETRRAAPVGDEPSAMSAKYGRLKDNIRVLRLKRDVPEGGALYRVDTGSAPWGYWREYGTSHQPAQPWFRPAVDGAFARVVNRIKERLARGVEREALKLGKGGR